MHEAIGLLMQMRAHPRHVFWLDSISASDPEVFSHEHLLVHGALTDSYLLGLAVANEGRLATFDRRIRLLAVRSATEAHLTVIPA